VTWTDWYYKNRDGFNESRRKQYEENPAKREAARLAAKEYRARRKAGLEISREMTRSQNGKQVVVHSSGAVADQIGCSRQMLVNWEERGWIPPTSFPDSHRLYTGAQKDLIELLSTRVNQAKRHGPRGIESRIIDTVIFVHQHWSD